MQDQKQGLTPEQKKTFDMIVRQAVTFLLEDDHAKLIIAKAKEGDPMDAVVGALQPVMQAIWGAAQEAGAQIETHVFLAAGIQVLTILSEMMAVSGVITEDQIPSFAAAAAKEAVKRHNESVGGQQQEPAPEQAPEAPAGLAATAGGA